MRDAAIDLLDPAPRSGAGRHSSGTKDGVARKPSSAAIAAQRLGGGRRVTAPAPPGPLRRLLARASRIRPFKVIAVAVFSAALVGIVANAVMFQKGRHPAPLLGAAPAPVLQAAAAPDAATPSKAAEPPAVRIASTPVSAPSQAVDDVTATAPPKPVGKHTPARHEDGIGKLLQGKADPAAAEAAPSSAKPDAALRAAQRQLAKLGYALKPDGHMSAATRHALRKFEQDHHLKAEAELTPAVRREIAAATASDAAPKAQ